MENLKCSRMSRQRQQSFAVVRTEVISSAASTLASLDLVPKQKQSKQLQRRRWRE